ncbi:MAG: PAS domain S-box protein, partial [Gemmatimonadetes bacterium]
MTPDVHRAALEALPQRVAILDSRGTLVYVNAAWRTAPDDPAQLGGGAYREGRDFVTLLGAAGSEAGRHMAEGVADVLEGRAPHFELEHPVGSGPEERWLHTRVDGLGGNGGAIVVQSDVTTRRRQSRRLASAELRLRQLAEHIDEVFFLTDPGWERLFYVSPAYEKVWGRPRQPLVAAPLAWTDAIHPEDAEAVRARMAEADDGAWRAEFRILRPDGTLRWIRAKTFPVRDPEGRVIRVAGVAADVTEHKLTERALERAHEETLEILERIPVGVVLNRAGEVLYMNTTAARYLGYGAGETLVGERLDDLLHPDERESLGPRIREMHADDDSEGREIRLRHASGEYVSLYVVPVRVIRYQGEPVNLIAAWDVTALRRAEAALEESAAERDRLEMQLETAQRIESLGRLAGGIAHDFNNLITVINGNVELALGLVGDGPAGDSLEEIRRAGTRAASLTDQLL